MNKFDSAELALRALTFEKKPQCVVALTDEYNKALAENLDVRTAYHRAKFLHYLHDHNGLDHGQKLDGISTDKEVEDWFLDALEKVDAGYDSDARGIHDNLNHWYKTFRSWGGDVYLSYVGAYEVAEEIYDETHDLPERLALQAIDGTPGGDSQFIANRRERFFELRGLGHTVRHSIEVVRQEALEILERELLQGLFTSGRVN